MIQNQALSAVDKCLAMLEAMNSGQGQSFTAMWDIYNLLLGQWGDVLSIKVCTHAALHCKWRPSPAELREIAAKLESPVPSADDAWSEVRSLVNQYGIHARPHPVRPTIRIAGPPDFTHPLIERVVRYCGGWEDVCDGKAQMQTGGLRGAFVATYTRTETEWVESVAKCLESQIRPAELFPVWKPFDISAAMVVVDTPRIVKASDNPSLPALPVTRYSRLLRNPSETRQIQGATK